LHGNSKLADNEKGETGEEESQEHDHHFFFGSKGTVHKEFVLAGQGVNSAHYCDGFLATA
jgi:hypothetical protein